MKGMCICGGGEKLNEGFTGEMALDLKPEKINRVSTDRYKGRSPGWWKTLSKGREGQRAMTSPSVSCGWTTGCGMTELRLKMGD